MYVRDFKHETGMQSATFLWANLIGFSSSVQMTSILARDVFLLLRVGSVWCWRRSVATGGCVAWFLQSYESVMPKLYTKVAWTVYLLSKYRVALLPSRDLCWWMRTYCAMELLSLQPPLVDSDDIPPWNVAWRIETSNDKDTDACFMCFLCAVEHYSKYP